MPVPFITAPLVSGPVPADNYAYTITGLVPGTIYEYRAYMIVDGNEICGTPTYQIVTAPTPVNLPTLNTCYITGVGQTTAQVCNAVTSDGGSAVSARGTAWNVGGSPTIADTHTVDGSGTGTFFSSLTGLNPNTTYFVRAYATNGVGTAYGSQCSFMTQALPNISLPIIRTSLSGSGPGQQSTGTIYPSPSLSAGQCITVNFNVIHNVFACNPTGGQNLTTIYCCSGGVWHIVSPSPFVTGAPAIGPPARCLGSYTLSVTIHQNERLCYVNQLATNSCCACGTSSILYILSASSSPNITVTPSNLDCLII